MKSLSTESKFLLHRFVDKICLDLLRIDAQVPSKKVAKEIQNQLKIFLKKGGFFNS